MKKIKEFFTKAGLTKLGFLAGAVASAIITGFGFVTGGLLGVFIYINFNVLYKMAVKK